MIEETLLEAEEKMDKAVDVAKEDFAGIRTGRATPGMFNKLPILVFELLAEGNIARAVKGEKIGTLVGDQGSRD